MCKFFPFQEISAPKLSCKVNTPFKDPTNLVYNIVKDIFSSLNSVTVSL